MLLLIFLPLELAHQIILPILWFLQVHRISDLATKDKTCKVHLFVASSYKPIQRIFASKIIASFLLLLILSSPIIVRYFITFDVLNVGFIIVGFIIVGFTFLISLALIFGQISKGKKLFEVVFFLVTYANINGIPFFDYFGSIKTDLRSFYAICFIILLFLGTSVFLKKYQTSK